MVARTVAGGMEKPLGQTIVVENRPGAATIIGATAVSQAEPSGYMIGTADSGTLAFNPSLYAKLSYDPSKFTYIGGIAKFPLLLAVNVNSPYKSVADVIAAAKKEPGKLTAASAGAGSPTIWRWSCSSSAPAPSCCTCPTRAPRPPSRTCWADRWT